LVTTFASIYVQKAQKFKISVIDFVGIELQILDTTSIVWPKRQRFLTEQNILAESEEGYGNKPYKMNWKITA
jgi:hypothetical protein